MKGNKSINTQQMLNKITIPQSQQLIQRPHLYERLKQSGAVSSVWICGPAGSGKTSLMSSFLSADSRPGIWYQVDAADKDLATFFYYLGKAVMPVIDNPDTPLPLLTPEYLMGIEAFAIRYFEKLFQRLTPPVWIVFDNFQELSADSPVLSILAQAVEQAPSGIRLAMLSRFAPPPAMVRLLANRKMIVMDNNQLAFTVDEYRALLDQGETALQENSIVRLHRATRGWIAGLILWLIQRQVEPDQSKAITETIPEMVFDYFAWEILNKTNQKTRQFLLKTALMPHMTIDMATRLTDMPAAEILGTLSRKNFFLEKREVNDTNIYQYHPLFRDFLIQQAARTFDAQHLGKLQCCAAGLMAEAGQVEEAMDLYRQARDYTTMVGLILDQALFLVVQGRNHTLAAWIDALPEDLADNQPWLLFWNGIALMPDKPIESTTGLIKAFEHFKQDQDLMGQIISWSALMESILRIRGTLEDSSRWLHEGEHLTALLPPGLDPGIDARFSSAMLAAICMYNPSHKDRGKWQARCESLLNQPIDQYVSASIRSNLLLSYQWLGQRIKARKMRDQLEQTLAHEDLLPLNRLSLLWCMVYTTLDEGNLSKTDDIICNALESADSSGVHFFDYMFLAYAAYAGLYIGDLKKAGEYLERAVKITPPSASWDIAQNQFIEGFLALLTGDWARAEHCLNSSRDLTESCGLPVPNALTTGSLAHLHLEQGHLSLALAELNRVKQTQIYQASGMIRFQYDLIRADYARVAHDTETMVVHLEKAFGDAQQNGLGMPVGIIRTRLAVLCAEALKAGIHPDIVKALIRRTQLPPPLMDQACEQWPWAVKLYCLGRLEVACREQFIDFGKKLPKKPLDLMYILISANHQSISRQNVADQLWADADGDRAVQNMNTTLHRLRKLIGDDQAVILKNNALSLNPSLCWVDTWQFEALVKKSRSASNPDTQLALLSQAMELYKGHLDGLDSDIPWVVTYAQRLRKIWINMVTDLAKLLRDTGHTEQLNAVQQRARAIDASADVQV